MMGHLFCTIIVAALFLPVTASAQTPATAMPVAAAAAAAAVTGSPVAPVPTPAMGNMPTVTLPPITAPTLAAGTGTAATAAVAIDNQGRMPLPNGALNPDGTPVAAEILASRSLLFTSSEISAVVSTLVRAARRPANRRPSATGGTLDGDGGLLTGPAEEELAPSYPPIPTKRTITLSGVLYRKAGDWVVWLNGHKLVPGKLLPEIVDMRVERDRVHLKWFDIGLGKVIGLTLRPHQTYDVTSGLLLTGERAP